MSFLVYVLKIDVYYTFENEYYITKQCQMVSKLLTENGVRVISKSVDLTFSQMPNYFSNDHPPPEWQSRAIKILVEQIQKKIPPMIVK